MIVDFRIVLPGPEQYPGGTEGLPYFMAHYKGIYDFDKLANGKLDDVVAEMEAGGVDRGVIQAEYMIGDFRAINEAVSRAVKAHPRRFVGFATVNPADSTNMASDVQDAYERLGLRGVNLQPWAYHLASTDRRFYPVYQKCLELNIPVTIHSSVNFSTDRSIEYGRPLYIDQIACDFPDLTIVANHGGWPWVTEMVAVAWKHPRVFIEFGGISPKYIGKPGTGWEPLMVYGNSLLQDQVLFATDSIIPYARAVPELKSLPLKDQVKGKWFGENALRLLNWAA